MHSWEGKKHTKEHPIATYSVSSYAGHAYLALTIELRKKGRSLLPLWQ